MLSINAHAAEIRDYEQELIIKYKCSKHLSYAENIEFEKEFRRAVSGIIEAKKSLKKYEDELELVEAVKYADSTYPARRLAALHKELFDRVHPITRYIGVSKRELAAIEEAFEAAYKSARLQRKGYRKDLNTLIEDCNHLIRRSRR